jgi:O-antigen/teichoic acid export membrane protein
MFLGVGLFNLFNLLYHFFMVRSLSPADYGHLNTLVSLFTIISVPAGAVQTTVTKSFSSFNTQNQYHRAIQLFRHFLLLMSIIGLSFFLLISLGSPYISSFLQISSRGLIILFGVSLVFAMVIPVPWGGLQGLQKFGLLSLNLIINGGLKFALGGLFVFLGLGLFGAMGAIAVSYLITTFLSLIVLGVILLKEKGVAHQQIFPREPLLSNISEIYRLIFSAGWALLCFMTLTNIDLILVKHFFTPVEAGYYSIAQMVGKIVLFLPLPIVMVMFPKLSSLERQGKAHSILGKSLGIAGVLCGGAVLFSLFFPLHVVKILSGKVYPECSALVRMFSINMAIFSLNSILLYYHLSTPKRWFLYPLSFFTLIEFGLIILFHNTLIQVLINVGIVAFCLVVINFYLAYLPYNNERRERFA